MKTNGWAGIRGAILTALAWAVMWAPVAVLIGLAIDPDGSMDEMWPAIGAYPGFLAALVFRGLIGFSARRDNADPSLAGVAARGALAGLLVGALPFTIGESASALPVWQLAAIVIGSITLMSTLSALATARLRRSGGRMRTDARTA